MKLRGGYETSDPRLGRIPQWDERNKDYPVRMLLTAKAPRSYTWRLPIHLNQGQTSACVGFSFAHELAARPVSVEGVSESAARSIYSSAKDLDEWPGSDYEGSSVLGGASPAPPRATTRSTAGPRRRVTWC